MKSDFISILLGLFEGFALIISPCILPILPIVLAGSLTGSRKRPVGIVTGFTLTFAIVAFFSRSFVQYSGIDLNLIRSMSYGILFFLGLIMLSTYLTEKFTVVTQRLAGIGSNFYTANNPQGGFSSGILLGGLIAIIWTPCAGPILAAVIVQIVIQKTNLISFFTLLAFALGAAIPMYIIAIYGLKIMDTFRFFKTKASLFRKILGGIIILSVAYMIAQENLIVSSSVAQTTIRTSKVLEHGLWRPYAEPKIAGIEAWINSPPLTLADLKGKVVLIDFWTYSCINCIRTLPYLKDWYQKYQNKGLVIIGIHTPEFDFEKKLANVQQAVVNYGLHYPVALDNQFITWQNFNNHYWPAHYLINKRGDVVYEHFGEGEYDVTENNIRFLLGIDEISELTKVQADTTSFLETAETYLGYERAVSNLSPSLVKDKVANYQFPEVLKSNAWALAGPWQVNVDKITSAGANAGLKIHFNAAKVFMVMGNSTAKSIKVNVLLNGEPLIADKGADVKHGIILVDKHSLFKVVDLPRFSSGILQIIAEEPGLEVYTFTFGG